LRPTPDKQIMVKAEAVDAAPKQPSKSFAFKILTSNPFAIKILQSIFANPAPVKPFRWGWVGGTLSTVQTGRIPDKTDRADS